MRYADYGATLTTKGFIESYIGADFDRLFILENVLWGWRLFQELVRWSESLVNLIILTNVQAVREVSERFKCSTTTMISRLFININAQITVGGYPKIVYMVSR